MKTKIKEALQQEYKNLGLNDEAFEGVAAFGETLGINEETLANFVKGAKDLLKREQSNADKVRNANATTAKQVEELKAKLAEAEAKLNKPSEGEGNKGDRPEQPDFAKLIAEAVTAAVQPLQDKIAAFEGAKSAEDAFNQAKEYIYSLDFSKQYPKQRDLAWKMAVKLNEATGNKMNADELKATAMEYLNESAAIVGVEDASKPFANEGDGNKEPNFEEHKRILQAQGLLPKDEN